NISKEYLDKIAQGYFSYFRQQNDIPVLVIDTNGIDFVNLPEDFEKIDNAIFVKQYEKGINRILL
ncbi:MAG: deoxynucleoside kinase, partial [Bacteroidota bacterium]|nr:deoxynucleoside kinase [Bacteroidota bacterium]